MYEFDENELEIIEKILSEKLIETMDKSLLPLIKKIRNYIDEE